ncbi:ABC transporter permease [Micromonospora yangpuensis]|uniref:Predicted ABC-type transport system involved in lysophospholipase L1 biosynthesis, permease component n=1 Tax=Micromonospora yangpuensis TaxID=683228 RepID=A0A1C6U632_9ACTN|nr:ABC transporter permease [Micromonospora yangpuensis]GGL91324.1 membrane protein [Micromonospora yangpuensis]SCL49434.1 Predicted ABC-type transport system involved in lysophospholipase L1 biosynthesis, permease component [Micromonospora yangpuensis]
MSAPGRRGPTAWLHDLLLGVRLSVAGGPTGWARLAMTAVGVGLGVAMLLTATALPTVGLARSDRSEGRDPGPDVTAAGPDTLLYAEADTDWRELRVEGLLVQPEGGQAPVPPGLSRLPAPGEMVVSPDLAELLASPDARLLVERLDATVVGTIAPEGLAGPRDLYYFRGADSLAAGSFGVSRTDTFGGGGGPGDSGSLPAVLLVLSLLGVVVLLLPVMIFVTTAVRFGSEARDRQLAAIRLVGADTTMTRRIAAGETLVGALLGMVVGALLFFGVGRLVGELLPVRFSFFPADLRPVPALVALVVLAVPTAAVLVTLSALRRVMIEPLGVVRRGRERRRQLWWRLLPPALGLLLLAPLTGRMSEVTGELVEVQVVAGITLLLLGLVLLLPWVVQSVVRRLGGGGVAWQLAVRRLQLDSDTAVRAVSGIAVSVAGIIAVQGVLGAGQLAAIGRYGDTSQFQASVSTYREPADRLAGQVATALAEAPGVGPVTAVSQLRTSPDTPAYVEMWIADCDGLRHYADLPSCADGDSFVASGRERPEVAPGATVTFDTDGDQTRWTVPADMRAVEQYDKLVMADLLVTPGALGAPAPEPVTYLAGLDGTDPDAIEQLRTAVYRIDPLAFVTGFARPGNGLLGDFEQALQVGAIALLLIIGASLLVNVLEQLRERRRLLAVLTAFGTRRRTLSGSVLYQVAIPVLLGLALAVVTGGGLGALLLAMVDEPIVFNWAAIAGVSGTAALVVLAVTAASQPLLWRLTRPDGLRSE